MDGRDLSSSTIVIDNGGRSLKAGYEGSQSPEVVLPACVGRPKFPRCMLGGSLSNDPLVGDAALKVRGLLSLSYPMDEGCVKDWESMELLWTKVYNTMGVKATDHPVLLTEAPLNPRKNRERLLEVFFESFHVPALYLSIEAALALYAGGRTSGVVLDSGDGKTSVCPIVEGFILTHALRRNDVAGRKVTSYLSRLLADSGRTFHSTSSLETVDEIKKQTCQISLSLSAAASAAAIAEAGGAFSASSGPGAVGSAMHLTSATMASAGTQTFTLPDGLQLQLGAERFRAPEVLFAPVVGGHEGLGAHQLLHTAIASSDFSLRKELATQIVLCGGTTMLSGYVDRLLAELRRLQPKDSLIRIYAPPDRDLVAFMGASILASLATFRKLLVSKTQYDEEGPAALHKRGF